MLAGVSLGFVWGPPLGVWFAARVGVLGWFGCLGLGNGGALLWF